MSYIKDNFIIVNRDDIEDSGDTGAGEVASGSGGGGSGRFSPDTISERVSSLHSHERILESEGFETNFRTETSADIVNAGPMASIAAAVTAALTTPVIDEGPKADIDDMSHIHTTMIAAQINDPKAQLIGNQWDNSELARTDKFFDGQQNAEQKNDAKLEDTEQAGATLAQGRNMLMGAAQDIRVDKYNAQTQTPGNNDAGSKPSAGGIAANAAMGSGMATVMDMLLPGAGAPIRVASAISTSTQSAAMIFGGDGAADKYDKPRSKSEARAKQSSSYSSGSSNAYDGTTSGQSIASVMPSANVSAFSKASAPAPDPVMDMKSMQIKMLEQAAAKLFDAEDKQASMHMQAKEADDAHEEYIDKGGADFDTNELFRAADKGMMSNVQETALIHAAKAENPDVIEKIEKRFELKNLDLTMGSSLASGPKFK